MAGQIEAARICARRDLRLPHRSTVHDERFVSIVMCQQYQTLDFTVDDELKK